jgi:hypothetical protein
VVNICISAIVLSLTPHAFNALSVMDGIVCTQKRTLCYGCNSSACRLTLIFLSELIYCSVLL